MVRRHFDLSEGPRGFSGQLLDLVAGFWLGFDASINP